LLWMKLLATWAELNAMQTIVVDEFGRGRSSDLLDSLV